MVTDVERHDLRYCGNSGIAGRAIESIEERALLELPGERVLAAASTYQQHVQCGKAPVYQAASLARGRHKQNGTADLNGRSHHKSVDQSRRIHRLGAFLRAQAYRGGGLWVGEAPR